MDAAIVLALVAGSGWAVNIVAVRWGLNRTGAPPLTAGAVAVTIAAVVATVVAVGTGDGLPSMGDVGRFALVGAIAPGSSQGLFNASIGAIGPSRTSVLVGTSPVFSVLLAIAFLDESWEAAIIVGTLFTVIGSAVISWEPGLTARRVGVTLALATALTFGVRDVVARQFTTESDVSSWWAGAVVLGAAAVTSSTLVAVRSRGDAAAGVRRALPEFVVSGVAIGIALPVLLEALDRGRVGLVAPLSLASQNIWVVILGAAVFGAHERTRRVLGALVLILAGATLVTTA